jgi:hypothetical protein
LDTTSKDEVRVIIAFGILAGILAYFQLKTTTTGGFFLIQPTTANLTNSASYLAIEYGLYIELFVFSMYLLFFSLAMGLDALFENGVAFRVLRDFANVVFFWGSFGLVPLSVSVLGYLAVESNPNASSAVLDSATYLGFVMLVLLLTALFFLAFKTRRGTDRLGLPSSRHALRNDFTEL